MLPSLLCQITLYSGSTEEFQTSGLKKEASSGRVLANAMPARYVDDSLSIRRLNNWQRAVQIQKNGKIQKYQPEAAVRLGWEAVGEFAR